MNEDLNIHKKMLPSTLVLTGMVVVAALLIMYLAIPSYKKLSVNAKRAAKANSSITQGQEYITDVQAAYRKLSANPNAVALLDTAVPTEPDIAGALVQLDGIVADSGLALNALAPSRGENGEYKISITASGNYEQLQKFLTSLENNLRPFGINNIVITAYSGDGQVLTAGDYSVEVSYLGASTAVSDAATQSTGTTTVTSGGGS